MAGTLILAAAPALHADDNDEAGKAKVKKAIVEAFPKAEITKIGKEVEDGIPLITVDFTVDGKKMDGDVSESGVLIAVEEPADMNDFPKAAAKAIKKVAKGAKIKLTEINHKYATAEKDAKTGVITVTKLAEPLLAYEADLEKDGLTGEVAVSAEGKVIEMPKWAKAKEKAAGADSTEKK